MIGIETNIMRNISIQSGIQIFHEGTLLSQEQSYNFNKIHRLYYAYRFGKACTQCSEQEHCH